MHPHPRFRFVTIPCGMLLAVTALSYGQDAPAPASNATDDQQTAYRSAIAQDTLRKDTEKIQAQLNGLAAELKANGLDNSDLKVLTNASNHLSNLSQDDMQKVINSLQSASSSSDKVQRLKDLVSAYQGQKSVSLQLKTLATDINVRESQKEIPAKLEVLIARQSANIRQTSSLKSAMSDREKSVHDVVTSEQNSIGGEINILFKGLAAAPAPVAAPTDGSAPAVPGPDIAKAALSSLNSSDLKNAAPQATQLTTDGQFPAAVAKQIAIRGYLTDALRAAVAGFDALTQLQAVKAQLDQIIADQKDLKEISQQSQLDGSILSERQARINDRTSITQALVKPLNQSAADAITTTQNDMDQSSTALLISKSPTETIPKQDQVVTDLEKVEALLDKQIADVQGQQNETPEQKLADLKELKNEIDKDKTDPKATKDDLAKAQTDAASKVPDAAADIAKASDKLPNKDAANADLAAASDAVQKAIDDETKTAEQVAALSKVSDQIAQAQADAAAAAAAMAAGNPTAAAHDNAQAQADAAAAAAAAPAAGAPDAAADLAAAQADAAEAKTDDVQAKADAAAAADAAAQAALAKAQAAVGQAMAAAQGQGQGQGQGEGQGQGQGQGNGPPQDLGKQGTGQGNGLAMSPDSVTGVLAGAGLGGGPGQVMGGLKQKDRDAINQYQAEKSPPDYAPLVQQYLKNLADTSDSH